MNTKKLKQLVLDLAIHGKLVPQDPNDEPASELLKRIVETHGRASNIGRASNKKSAISSDKIDEVPFEVPEGWVWCRLGDVMSVKSGTALNVRNINGGIFPIYGGNGINGFHDCFNVDEETLLIGRVGFYCGSIHKTKSKSWVTDNALIVSSENVFYNDYLYWLLIWMNLGSTSNSTAQPVVSGKGILPLPIPIPPLSEQRRIVAKIENWFGIIDQLESNEADLRKSIEQTKKKVLDLAIHGKLVPQDPNDEPASELLKRIVETHGRASNKKSAISSEEIDEVPFEVPEGWVWTKLGEIGKWQSGSTPSRANKCYYGGDIPWLKTGDLNDGFITEISESITEEALKNTSVKLNPTDSVLIAMYGATIGKVGILTFPATTNQACCACSEYFIDKMYLFYFLLQERNKFIYKAGGGAQPNISKEIIVDTFIPLPPLSEQRRIVAKIEEVFGELDRMLEMIG